MMLKNCGHCGKPFGPKMGRESNFRKAIYCGRECYDAGGRGYRKEQAIAAFWSRVDKSGGEGACWPWTATKLPEGYGIVSMKSAGLKYPAGTHRVAYWLSNGGEFPKDPLCVLHSCDNPKCCNPKHLSLGDRLANAADRRAKGRDKRKPDGTSWKKMTPEKVIEFRKLRAEGWTYQRLCDKYGLSKTGALYIGRNITWKGVAATAQAPPSNSTR